MRRGTCSARYTPTRSFPLNREGLVVWFPPTVRPVYGVKNDDARPLVCVLREQRQVLDCKRGRAFYDLQLSLRPKLPAIRPQQTEEALVRVSRIGRHCQSRLATRTKHSCEGLIQSLRAFQDAQRPGVIPNLRRGDRCKLLILQSGRVLANGSTKAASVLHAALVPSISYWHVSGYRRTT
jgi:hypothetical protein